MTLWLAVLLPSVLVPASLPVWLAAPPPGVATRMVEQGGAILVGTELGLYQREGRGWRLLLARGGVLDLVGLGSGWLAAAERGLYESQEGEVRALSLGAGARARALAVDETGGVWVATDAGLYARRPEASAFALDTGLPAGGVRSVRAVGSRVWLSRDGEIWLREARGAWKPRLRGLGPGWWELVGAASIEGGVLLAVPRGLWRIEGESADRIEHGAGDLRALVLSGRAVWLASTRGLLRTGLDRLDRGVPEVVVEGEAFDAVESAGALLVATRNGVAQLQPAPVAAVARAPLGYRRARSDPLDVQRATIAYQGLSPSKMRRLSERARNSAWWPQLRLSAAWERDRERDADLDQTFSSGSIHDLRDSARARDTSFGLDLQLTWDLARVAEPDEQLAISRERRELVELRDQVLERVNRLQFERQRVLERREVAPVEEHRELTLRARELAAQLDAWTGGQFSLLENGRRENGTDRSPPLGRLP